MKIYNKMYIVIMIIVILILFFANQIIVFIFSNEFYVKEINKNELEYKDTVLYAVDLNEPIENLLEEFDISGWALCSTELDNINKQINIILNSEEHTYLVNTSIYERVDANNLFKEYKNAYNRGFGVRFSSINIKNGEYSILIEDIENEENYGVVDTGIIIKKDRNGIRRYYPERDFISIKIDDENINEIAIKEVGMKYSVDEISISDNNQLVIRGWAVEEEVDSSPQSVIVELYNIDKDKLGTYTTYKYKRSDVADVLQRPEYLLSGFRASIEIEEEFDINKLAYTRIILKDEEKILCSDYIVRKQAFEASNENINITDISNDVRFHFDSPDEVDDCFVIRGWGFVNDKDSVEQEVYLYITPEDGETVFYETYQSERPDVKDAFDNSDYLNSGIKSNIQKDLFPGGDSNIGFVIYNDGVYITPSVHVKHTDEGIMILN